MKNFNVFMAFCALALTLVCCRGNDVTPTTSGSMTFKIDSTTTFTSSTIGSVWEPATSLLNITAKGGKSIIVMNLAMPNGIKAGTYNFTATSTPTATYYRPDTSKITEGYYSNIDAKTFGTLIITSVTTDSLITGTFTYNLKDPTSAIIKKITAGVFTKVKVINNKSIVSTGGNTFTVKVDGTAFVPTQITALNSLGKIAIVASNGTKTVGITVTNTVAAGNYTMDFFTNNYIGQYNPTFSATSTSYFVASTATSKLTITEHNTTTKSLKGTFNFKATDFAGTSTTSYLLTEGTFAVKY
jgi:Family of unknown function (DUF6252)